MIEPSFCFELVMGCANGFSIADEREMRDEGVGSMSAPSRNEGFLNAMEVQVAGGAAGEDRVQAVCSEENGWLFCAIYDGFNGRDAADFLAGTLYENIIHQTRLLDCELKQDVTGDLNGFYPHGPFQHAFKEADNSHVEKPPAGTLDENNSSIKKSVNNALVHDSSGSKILGLNVLFSSSPPLQS